MPSGDQMWTCKYCGRTHYWANRELDMCDCPKSREVQGLSEKFEAFFTDAAANVGINPNEPIPVSMRVPTTEIGVIIGRFQCSRLHAGYQELFNFVFKRHPRVFVFIGATPVKGSKKDPLPFQARRAMIETMYPTFEVFKMDDVFDVDKWSNVLDRQIDLLGGPGQTATLYGSRDCTKYTGKHTFEEVPCLTTVSSSKIRKEIGLRWQNDEKWREGVIWLSQNRFPVVYPTVDIALLNLEHGEVLLGKKPTDSLWRFPGGFADIHSDSYESDALRELKEECSVEGTSLEYIGSTIVDDARYRNQEDKIKTMFYAATAWRGDPKAGDDLSEVKWFSLDELEGDGKNKLIVSTHRVLATMLLNWKAKLVARVQQAKKQKLV